MVGLPWRTNLKYTKAGGKGQRRSERESLISMPPRSYVTSTGTLSVYRYLSSLSTFLHALNACRSDVHYDRGLTTEGIR